MLPLIIGISGASGVLYGIKLLEITKGIPSLETHLIISKAAELTLHYETEESLERIKSLATYYHPIKNIGATIASGSVKTGGMIIAPCSIKTMSEIANGITSSLLSRAADVCLKERRPLILGVREMPFHTGHLRTMTQLSEMGAIVAPPLPAFYHQNLTLDMMIEQICARWLSLVGIECDIKQEWTGRKN